MTADVDDVDELVVVDVVELLVAGDAELLRLFSLFLFEFLLLLFDTTLLFVVFDDVDVDVDDDGDGDGDRHDTIERGESTTICKAPVDELLLCKLEFGVIDLWIDVEDEPFIR